MMALSELLGVPVRGADGAEIGRARDVVVRFDNVDGGHAKAYPRVVGLIIEGDLERAGGDGDTFFVPWGLVADAGAGAVALTGPLSDARPSAPSEDELSLREGLLDRLVVDVAQGRLARVNDVELAERDGALRLVAVDVGPRALLRRLGVGRLGERLLARLSGSARSSGPVDWEQVVPLPDGDVRGAVPPPWLRLKTAALAGLGPEDLADLACDLSPRQAAALLAATDAAVAAAAVEQMADEQQAQVLRAMDPERAADVLDEMDPDEAADAIQALREVDTDDANNLLGRMERDEAADVRELAEYPGDSAGGLMTTDYVAVPPYVGVGAVLAALRERERAAAAGEADPVPEALADIYVVDPGPRAADPSGRVTLDTEGRLVGIVGLRELVLAEPGATLSSAMREMDAVAHPLDDARAVARAIADADVVALPVVDDDGVLVGIVTVDDAIDILLPGQWRARGSRRGR